MTAHPDLRRTPRFATFALIALGLFHLSGCAPLPKSDNQSLGAGAETTSVSATDSHTQINDTARFLAGMPGGGNARLKALRSTSGWQSHSRRMDQLFGYFDRGYLPKLRGFRGELGGLTAPGIVFYPFGGPDYLYANGFFPGARNYVLVGLEGVESLPDLGALGNGEIQAGLNGLSRSLKTITGASYFITKDLRIDLESTVFRGTLPVLLAMIARSGRNIQSVTAVGLDSSGSLTSRSAGAACPGWHIVAGGKHIYYFRENLSNGSLGHDKRLLAFVRSKGAPVTFVKSASYLMHSADFSVVRDFVIKDSRAILQGASGVPYRFLRDSGLSLTLYGNYVRPLDMFSQHYQADLAAAFRDKRPHPVKPIAFGVGYLRNPSTACLILARR